MAGAGLLRQVICFKQEATGVSSKYYITTLLHGKSSANTSVNTFRGHFEMSYIIALQKCCCTLHKYIINLFRKVSERLY